MNNKYYANPSFPGAPIYSGTTSTTDRVNNLTQSLPLEQSYIENILRLNKNKKVQIHMSFPDSNEWKDSIFSGIIEESGRDHIILSDPATGKWHLLLMIYVDYITFDEKINYSPEFIPNDWKKT